MSNPSQHMIIRSGAALCGFLLSLVLLSAFAANAWATSTEDQLADAQSSLDSAEAKVTQLTSEYEDLQDQIAQTEEDIATASQKVLDAQAAVLEGQEKLASSCRYSYKTSTQSWLELLLGSTSMGELFDNIQYILSVQEYQAQVVQEQKDNQEQLAAALADLNDKKALEDQQLEEADEKLQEAQDVVDEVSAKVSDLEDQVAAEKEAARLKALKEQQEKLAAEKALKEAAEKKAAEEAQAAQSESEDWDTQESTSKTDVTPVDDSEAEAAEAQDTSSTDTPDGTWLTGLASAYGGSTDSSCTNPAHTATGAICNDSSLGVAVPMSLTNYRSYFGKTVEIYYNGKTVVGTVNDCGGLAGGARALDLQPGIWKQFGFTSCNGWGVRTVKYRFL